MLRCVRCGKKFNGDESFLSLWYTFSIDGRNLKMCTKCLRETVIEWFIKSKEVDVLKEG